MSGGERPYEHPGHAYISRSGIPHRHADLPRYIEGYVAFLREESNANEIPVDLDRICTRFGITWKIGTLPVGTEGWSDGEEGHIHLREDSLYTRRRFTHGHELVELLFFALMESRVSDDVWHHLQGRRKEVLCNQGAATLLLPRGTFEASARMQGVSVPAARALAEAHEASLLATLIGLVERGPGLHALVGWRRALKPREKTRASPGQLALGPDLESAPVERLRVGWVRHTRGRVVPYIPAHKSIPDDSLVGRVALTGREATGHEELSLGGLSARCYVEVLPGADGVADVVTLIHLPGDLGCSGENETALLSSSSHPATFHKEEGLPSGF